MIIAMRAMHQTKLVSAAADGVRDFFFFFKTLDKTELMLCVTYRALVGAAASHKSCKTLPLPDHSWCSALSRSLSLLPPTLAFAVCAYLRHYMYIYTCAIPACSPSCVFCSYNTRVCKTHVDQSPMMVASAARRRREISLGCAIYAATTTKASLFTTCNVN